MVSVETAEGETSSQTCALLFVCSFLLLIARHVFICCQKKSVWDSLTSKNTLPPPQPPPSVLFPRIWNTWSVSTFHLHSRVTSSLRLRPTSGGGGGRVTKVSRLSCQRRFLVLSGTCKGSTKTAGHCVGSQQIDQWSVKWPFENNNVVLLSWSVKRAAVHEPGCSTSI